MDNKFRNKGLAIIGAECHEATNKQIKAITNKAKVTFTITKKVTGPPIIRGLPTALVFNTKGILIYQGQHQSPKFKKIITDALKKVDLKKITLTNIKISTKPQTKIKQPPPTSKN